MKLSTLLETVTDGEEHGWDTEFQWIEEHSPNDLNGLLEDIRQNGIQNPVLIGPDNRVWDGHHRVWAAQKLGLETIPAERIQPVTDLDKLAALIELLDSPVHADAGTHAPWCTECPVPLFSRPPLEIAQAIINAGWRRESGSDS